MYLKTKLLNLSIITGYLDLEKKTIFLGRKNKDTCLILHDIVTPLTTLLVSEIKNNGCPDTAIEGFRCLARLSLVVNHLK